VVVYYFLLDVPLALAMLLITGILVCREKESPAGHAQAGLVRLLFVGGWICNSSAMCSRAQAALTDNLFQIFVAPIFLCASCSLR